MTIAIKNIWPRNLLTDCVFRHCHKNRVIMELTAQTVWSMFFIKEIGHAATDRAIHPMLPR